MNDDLSNKLVDQLLGEGLKELITKGAIRILNRQRLFDETILITLIDLTGKLYIMAFRELDKLLPNRIERFLR